MATDLFSIRFLPILKQLPPEFFTSVNPAPDVQPSWQRNTWGYTNLITAIQAMLIGKAAGIDPAVLAEIVPVSAGASRAFNAIPNAILDGSYQAGGTLDIVAKDVALACALAARLNVPATTGSAADALYRAAQERGWGSDGYPVVARILEELAGQSLSES